MWNQPPVRHVTAFLPTKSGWKDVARFEPQRKPSWEAARRLPLLAQLLFSKWNAPAGRRPCTPAPIITHSPHLSGFSLVPAAVWIAYHLRGGATSSGTRMSIHNAKTVIKTTQRSPVASPFMAVRHHNQTVSIVPHTFHTHVINSVNRTVELSERVSPPSPGTGHQQVGGRTGPPPPGPSVCNEGGTNEHPDTLTLGCSWAASCPLPRLRRASWARAWSPALESSASPPSFGDGDQHSADHLGEATPQQRRSILV